MNNPIDHLNIDPRLKKILPYVISAILLVAVLGIAFVAAWSSDQTSQALPSLGGAELASRPSTFDVTLDVILKIVFVFGLMYAFFAMLRWWQKRQPGEVQSRLKIIETIRPSQRQTFYLVRVDAQEFLIGATDQSISLISEIEPDFNSETEQIESEAPERPDSNFNAVLQQTLKPALNLFQQPALKKVPVDSKQQVIK